MTPWLRLIEANRVPNELRRPVDPGTLLEAGRIIEDVRARGEAAVREHAERLGDLEPGEQLVIGADMLDEAVRELPDDVQDLLARAIGRIELFAKAQRDTVDDVAIDVEGGRAGHRWLPVSTVGAYAPGGRYPLPSTVLMTVVPARVAGVSRTWVASPRPNQLTLAAAGLAGAEGVLRVGGAQAIAALAFGIGSPSCDMVVGPGNRWVTAAKKLLFGEIGVDGLAGPSEIVVIADDSADPAMVAADLIAQAEHDVDALPILLATDAALYEKVEVQITEQMDGLATSSVAEPALRNGFAVVSGDVETAVDLSDQIAPEHLALHVSHPDRIANLLSNYGSLFSGAASAEAFADYGAGPNHVLPTGGGARFQSGLSPMTFLRSPTWLRLDDPGALIEDTAALARMEQLEGHARAAEARGRRGL